MTQLKRAVEPFGEVNVRPLTNKKLKVTATILMEPHKEGAQTGIALDGSGSMQSAYGTKATGGFLSSILGGKEGNPNEVTPVAQAICSYLARKVDADGGTTSIYWATGNGGSQVEVIGDLTADQAEKHVFGGPSNFGTGTQLLPAMKYFVERFKDAPWGFYVFVTDGELHDLAAVKSYTIQLAKEIAGKKRNPLKFVLVGVGPNVQEQQMIELDDLEAPVDLWDHKVAKEMRCLQEIFAEVVDANARVSSSGRVLDPSGNVVKDFSDVGVPALLEFEIDNVPYFTLEVNGSLIHQPLSDTASAPASQINTERTTTVRQPVTLKESTIIAPGLTTQADDQVVNEFDVGDEIERQKKGV